MQAKETMEFKISQTWRKSRHRTVPGASGLTTPTPVTTTRRHGTVMVNRIKQTTYWFNEILTAQASLCVVSLPWAVLSVWPSVRRSVSILRPMALPDERPQLSPPFEPSHAIVLSELTAEERDLYTEL